MKNRFWQSDTYKIIKAMRATGNQRGIIAGWIDETKRWAENNPNNPDAKSVLAWLPHWRVRPFYTSEELAPIFPVLSVVLGITENPGPYKSPARLENELDYGGLPHFWTDGKKYYIVEQIHKWLYLCNTENENVPTF